MWQEAKKFDANLDYTERPCLSREKKTEDGRKIGRKERKEGGKKGRRERGNVTYLRKRSVQSQHYTV